MPSRVGSSNAARRDDYCTGIQFGVMNCADFPGECLCGSIDFERIVVQRKPNAPITTDFVACLACRAMYFVPLPPIVVTPREGPIGGGAIGGPDGGLSCNSPPPNRPR